MAKKQRAVRKGGAGPEHRPQQTGIYSDAFVLVRAQITNASNGG